MAPAAELQRTNILLSPAELQNLKNGVYQYNCVNEALLEPYLNIFWEWLAARLPRWIHPNVLTLVGSLAIIPSFFLYAYLSWSMQDPPPAWLTFLALLGIFIFQTLDNLDGKQARALRLSSPIGDWFDHSLDILSLYMLITQVLSAVSYGHTHHPMLLILTQLAPAVMHFCVFWDRRWTKELYLGPFSITEGQFIIMMVLVAGNLLDAQFWSRQVVGDYSSADLLTFPPILIFTLLSPLGMVLRVIKHPRRIEPLSKIFLRFADIFIAYAGAVTWAWLSPTLYDNPRLLAWTLGLATTNVTTCMLLESLMHGPSRGIRFCFLSWLGVLNALAGFPLADGLVVIVVLLVALAIQSYILYGSLRDMRGFLQFKLFHVPLENQRLASRAAK